MLARNRTSAPARDLGELRLEVGEHVELRVERLAVVQVPAVVAAPEERPPAGDVLDVVGVDAAGVRARRARPSPKSSPTGPTTCTSSKNDAASAKCTAEPPSIRSRDPNGVVTASNAIEPTTVTDIGGQR